MADFNGIVVINKEKGFTSHDAVNVVRKIFNMRKVGHTGTLDPEATGVLPICLGKATRVSDLIMGSGKEYIAEMKLGTKTDTQDIWGEVIEQSDKKVTEEEFASAIKSFVGEYDQIPPMYSAIKIDGKKLYEIARQGKEVERKPRRVNIDYIEILDVKESEARIKVGCSKGTYIRTLINDIGEKLGTYACMTSLQRTKSGVFDISEAYTLDELKNIKENDDLRKVLHGADYVFSPLERIDLSEELKERFLNGARSTVENKAGRYRVYDCQGNFLGIGYVEEDKKRNVLKTEKNFYVEG